MAQLHEAVPTRDLPRASGIDRVDELLREYVRDGSADARVVIGPIPDHEWEELEGRIANRHPDGPVKVLWVAHGIRVEFTRGQA